MKVIVTGGSGFVGRHLRRALQERGLDVFNYDIAEDLSLDVCDYEMLCSVIEEGDKIVHLAAVTDYAQSESDPAETWRTNTGGTATVLKAANACGAVKVVHASTVSVYMPIQYTPIPEDHPINGVNNYGISKVMAERVFDFYHVPHIILRYAYIYGSGRPVGVVRAFLDAVENGTAPCIYGGDQTNDLCYVKDVVRATTLALGGKMHNCAINVGSGIEISTRDVFKILRRVTGYDGKVERLSRRASDPRRIALNLTRANTLLGYTPQYDFEAGVRDMEESS